MVEKSFKERNPSFPRNQSGDNRIRTDGFLRAKQTLYQLSYTPAFPIRSSMCILLCQRERVPEKMGFEPMIPKTRYTDLANQRYRPLSHFSTPFAYSQVCSSFPIQSSISILSRIFKYVSFFWEKTIQEFFLRRLFSGRVLSFKRFSKEKHNQRLDIPERVRQECSQLVEGLRRIEPQ